VLELMRNLEELVDRTVPLCGKSDIARSFFQQFGEPLAALGKWSVAQAGSFQADQIEGVVNNRNFLIASVGLEELKKRFPFIVKRSNLAVDDGLLSR
jgi:hypothetical protein